MNQGNFIDIHALKENVVESTKNADRNLLAILRVAFSLAAILIVLKTTESSVLLQKLNIFIAFTYLIYSLCCLRDSIGRKRTSQDRICYWIDVIFFTYFISDLGLYETAFFSMYIYPIIAASRMNSARQGALVTFATVGLYLTTAAFAADSDKDLSGIVLRAVSLSFLGCVISYLAATEELARKKLSFLFEINESWNPRSGMDQTVLANLKRMVTFYNADSGVLVLHHPSSPSVWMMYTFISTGQAKASKISEAAAAPLTDLPIGVSIAYNDRSCSIRHRMSGYIELNETSDITIRNYNNKCEVVRNVLDTCAFATAPYSQKDGTEGRIFITSGKTAFSGHDLVFLTQVSKVVSIVIENMSLTDRFISKAADYERLKISRDMHDTTIQPYIGLKIALEALYRKAGDTPLASQIAEILHMCSSTISDLRTYTDQLRERASMPGENLIAALSKQAETYEKYYGIAIDIRNNIEAPINGQIAAELFQMLSEGLSNILRHTAAKIAFVSVHSTASLVTLEVGNESGDAPEIRQEAFTPRSISERAASLGGSVRVDIADDRFTVVHIEVPNLLNFEDHYATQ